MSRPLSSIHDESASTADVVGQSSNVDTSTPVTICRQAELVRDAADSASSIVYTVPHEGDIEESVADIARAKAPIWGTHPRPTSPMA